jgi:hypothetical protein
VYYTGCWSIGIQLVERGDGQRSYSLCRYLL